MANLELAEPMEMGAQSSVNESAQSKMLDEMVESRNSPQ